MFKKSLLALALAGAAMSATAATVITNETGVTAISSQGLPATKAITIKPTGGTTSVEFTLAAGDNTGIVPGGRLVIDITGAFFSAPAGTTIGLAGTDIGAAHAITVSADSTSSQLILDLDAGDVWTIAAADNVISIEDLAIIVTGTDVKLSSVFQSATKVDFPSTAGPAIKVATVSDQWKAGVVLDLDSDPTVSGKLNAKIDVGNDRETFESEATSDVLTFDVNTSGTGAVVTDVTVTIAGDFTGVKSVVADNTGTATYVINSAKTEAAYTYTSSTDTTAAEVLDGTSAVTLALNTVAADVIALEARSYDVTLDVDYKDAEAVQHNLLALDAADAGKWDLNGTSVTVEYVPYGPNTQVILQATSQFDEDVMYDVSYLNAVTGKMVSLTDVGTITANSVSKIGEEIATAIKADSATESGKTRIVVSVNAPSGKVSFFSAFKDVADKDRLGL